jgi:hypothetical protein
LFVCTAAVSGLWLKPSGLTTLARNVVVSLSGACSFCGKSIDAVHAMARSVGTPVRICNECVALCLDILRDGGVTPGDAPADPDARMDHLIRDLIKLRDLESGAYARELDEMIKDLRARLDGDPEPPRSRLGDLACSMCNASHRDVRKLIAGPTVYICDTCIGEAAVATRLFVT